MKKGIYTIYDKGATEHSDPFVCISRDVAIRVFKTSLTRIEWYFRDDYELHFHGFFTSSPEEAENSVLFDLERPTVVLTCPQVNDFLLEYESRIKGESV